MLSLFKHKNEKAISPKILIIDDSPEIRDIIQMRLENVNYKSITAQNGKEGLEKAEAENPDLILLDIKMPVMDGYDTLRQLRQNPNLKDMPVIMVTASHKAENIATALSYGITDYVVKPFDHIELINKINKAFNL